MSTPPSSIRLHGGANQPTKETRLMAKRIFSPRANRCKNITGQKFGNLTPIHKYGCGDTKVKGSNWVCRCECGHWKITRVAYLVRGDVKSCGCLVRRTSGKGMFMRKKLDEIGRKLYRVWRGMKVRCLQKSHHSYQFYGARGVTVCQRWMKFENFHTDMRNGFEFGLTIDRIDSGKGYSPENCRWLTMKEQSNNRKTNKKP